MRAPHGETRKTQPMTFVEDAPGRMLAGKYELLEKLGQGGMAIVWRARTLGAAGFFFNVAVKRLEAAGRGFEGGTEKFVGEGRGGAALPHPKNVPVHDFCGEEEGPLYLVDE